MRRLGVIVAVLLALAVGLAAFAGARLNHFLHSPMSVGAEGADFLVAPGSSFRAVSDELESLGYLSNSLAFRTWARWTGQAGGIHAGDYHIRSGTTPAELLDQLVRGDVKLYSFTIIEGWNYRELLTAMHADEHIEATMTDEDWPGLLDEIGSDIRHPEGLFLPETYRFPRNATDRQLLKQAYDQMQDVLREEWADRADGLSVSSPYEALILASIIEKETARGDERQRISGVFTRRLEKRMRLQTDPTVIYGIGPEFNGNLTRRDLRTDTPYNTYTRGGLPPTPIAMPGRAAIHAALHPADGEELYFVATGLGDGSHAFSVTKEEHDAAVAEYLRRLRQRRD
jgi:UPF0755 protein